MNVDFDRVVSEGPYEGKTLREVYDEAWARVSAQPLSGQTEQQRRNLFDAQFEQAVEQGFI